jgi:(p)ppGpp synthase/HD superfamily hydrolase
MHLPKRYKNALKFSFKLHQGQERKGSEIPYLAHLLSVSSLVMENGGDEDQAIAALLHDAVEDQGGYQTLDRIRKKFGGTVAEIVAGCTDAYTDPKPEWKPRKIAYLENLRGADKKILLVSLADKVHNARSILADLQDKGDAVWKIFKGGREGTIWYYQSLVDIFDETGFTRLKEELHHLVDEIIRISGSPEK